MSPDRFRQILDAYGADPRRWPQAERASASAFAAAHPEVRAWLVEADGLDARLDDWAALDASPALRARVLGGAPRPRRAGLFQPWIAGLGAALAAACAAGAVFGVALAQPALQAARADAAIASAARDFGDPAPEAPRVNIGGDAG